MEEEIYYEIIGPIDAYLDGEVSEKEINWSDVRYAASRLRKAKAFYDVREALKPYYQKLLLADKDFFRNGNSDSQAKKTILDLLEREGHYAGRLLHDVDIVKAAENWASQLIPDNHEPKFFFWMMKVMLERDYKPDWNNVYDSLKIKLSKAKYSGNFKLNEMHCLLMGITMIERTTHPREKKKELFRLLQDNWGFLRYMYSVLIGCIAGLRVDNFAAVAHSACSRKTSRPYIHIFYKAFKAKYHVLCPEEMIDTHSGENVRTQAERHIAEMEQIIKSTPQSDCLNELCDILFPLVIKDVLKQSRPKTYEELENAVDDLTSRYNKVLEQLTNAVKDVESDKISADDLTAAFLLFPPELALSFFSNMATLLAQNPTWQKHAPMIQQKILAKKEMERIHVEGDYVIEKRVENEVKHVEAGATGIIIEREDRK